MMDALHDYKANERQTALAGSTVPRDFTRITEHLHSRLDRKLGYFGDERFVEFYYEPRVDGVVWKDSVSHGFGSGAWCAFLDQMAPLTDFYEVNVGCGEAEGPHVLVIDRVGQQAYFADRQLAEQFLTRQADAPPSQ